MSDSARLYAYKALFDGKRLVTRADMMAVAEVSLATFKRDIAKLRDQMGMPILFDKDRGGYYLDRNEPDPVTWTPRSTKSVIHGRLVRSLATNRNRPAVGNAVPLIATAPVALGLTRRASAARIRPA